jgi:hypothetical protein
MTKYIPSILAAGQLFFPGAPFPLLFYVRFSFIFLFTLSICPLLFCFCHRHAVNKKKDLCNLRYHTITEADVIQPVDATHSNSQEQIPDISSSTDLPQVAPPLIVRLPCQDPKKRTRKRISRQVAKCNTEIVDLYLNLYLEFVIGNLNGLHLQIE